MTDIVKIREKIKEAETNIAIEESRITEIDKDLKGEFGIETIQQAQKVLKKFEEKAQKAEILYKDKEGELIEKAEKLGINNE